MSIEQVSIEEQESKPDAYTEKAITDYLDGLLGEFGSTLGDFPQDAQERWRNGLWDLIDSEAVYRATGGQQFSTIMRRIVLTITKPLRIIKRRRKYKSTMTSQINFAIHYEPTEPADFWRAIAKRQRSRRRIEQAKYDEQQRELHQFVASIVLLSH